MTEDFYSVVYVAPNHLTNERVSIGLIVVSNGVPYFNFSMTKLKWLSYDLIKAPVKKHMQEIESIIAEEQKSKVLRLFNYRFAKEVFEELSKKSRGLVVFDSPQEIHTEVNSIYFEKLFTELIGAKPNKIAEKKKLPMRVKWTHWLRRQDELKEGYQYSLEQFSWVKVDYALVSGESIELYHCVDPTISKKSFKQAMAQFELNLRVIQQEFNKVSFYLVHGEDLGKSAEKLISNNFPENWISFDDAKKKLV